MFDDSGLVPGLLHVGLGVAIFLVTSAWQRLAHRWDSWFPALRSGAKYIMYLGVAAIGLAGIYLLAIAEDRLLMAATVVGGIGLLPFIRLAAMSSQRRGEEHTRGATSDSAAALSRAIKKEGKPTYLEFGGAPLPVGSEPYHIMVAGSTGSGKSVALMGLIDALRARGDTCVLVDSGGELVSRYWNPAAGDVLINPFDARCAPWSPTAEIAGEWDAEAVAMSIVPDATGDSKEWNKYAQTFLTSLLRALRARNACTLKDFLYFAQAATVKELSVLLAGTPAAPQLEAEKTFGSIRTITTNYLRPFNYLVEGEANFSVADFCRQAKGNFLYLTYREDQLQVLRTLIAAVLDTAARTILSMPADSKRRIWLIIDEFGSLGAVQSIIPMATKARKAGGCLVIGVQTTSQLYSVYGTHDAQTILSCLSTWLVMRCGDADTAEYMSRHLGEEEIVRTSQGSSASASGDTTSWNEQVAMQRLVLPAEIQQMNVGHGVVKLAGNYPLCRVSINNIEKKPNQAEHFLLRDYTTRPMMALASSLTLEPPPPSAPPPSAPPPAATGRVIRPLRTS